MTSNTLTNFSSTTVELDKSFSQPISISGNIIGKILSLFARSELEKSQAQYRAKQLYTDRMQVQQDIVNTFPLENKLRLGMYHWMD